MYLVTESKEIAIFQKVSSGEIKKMWIYTSTPPYAFMA
jgi:hypothetical protein